MTEENKQPLEEETAKTEEAQAEPAEEAAEKAAKGRKKKEKGITFTKEQVEQMEQAVRQLEATKEQFTRLAAEYDNYRKRTGEDDPHKKGLEMIFTQYKELLKKLGVSEIEAQGRPFDPERHEAVMHVDDEKFGENEVAQVFQAGFALGDKVIRHAVVQVAN